MPLDSPAPNPAEQPFAHDGGPVGVVVCHGFTGNPSSMRPWADHLVSAGYSVRLPLLPGHGTTWQDTNATTWPQWYGVVESAYAELAARCGTVFAVGLSMGGTLVTRLAAQHGDGVAGLVLVNPAFGTMRRDAKLVPVLKKVIKSRPAIGGDINKPGVVESATKRLPVVAFASLQELWRDTVAQLGKVTAPIRLYRSVTDHVVDPLSARLLKQGATATTVEEIMLANSYHVATLDYDAEQIFTGSVEFMRSLTEGTA